MFGTQVYTCSIMVMTLEDDSFPPHTKVKNILG